MSFDGTPAVVGPRVAAGKITMPGSGTNAYVAAVTFPVGKFSAPPVVVTDSETAAIINTTHEPATATGCIVHAYWTDELAHSGGGVVTWISVQM